MSEPYLLVVDDDPNILYAVRLALELEGYRVRTANNPVKALSVMEETAPDLIISDVTMPEMNGYQFYQAVREHAGWVDIPFLFLSANTRSDDVQEGYALGADRYLTKPLRVEELLTAVQSRLKRRDEINMVAEKSLEQTKRQLLRVFSHELRTPLSFIKGYLNFFQEGQPVTSDILDPILIGVNRLENLINDLLLVFNLESESNMRLIKEYGHPVSLYAVIHEAQARLAKAAAEKQVSFASNIDRMHMVWGMADFTEGIFYRILDNAVKFSPEGGEILITDELDGEKLRIQIADRGPGISDENLTSLFQKFSQIDRDKQEQQGVGLGLAITEKLVRLHQGEIDVENRVGGGTVVTIILPLLPS